MDLDLAQVVNRQVMGDREKPGCERSGDVIFCQRSETPDERIKRYFFGIIMVFDQAVYKAEYAVLIKVEDLPARGLIMLQCPGNERSVYVRNAFRVNRSFPVQWRRIFWLRPYRSIPA
jgi:hypothetical protein